MMEIDANNSVVIGHFLALSGDMGWNWVAFGLPLSGQIDNLHGFETAGEAIEFCRASNIRFDYNEQDFMEVNFQYLPLPTLLEAIRPALGS